MRPAVRSLALALLLLALGSTTATAAPTSYSLSLGAHVPSHVTIDGDQLTDLRVTVFLASCSAGPGTYVMTGGDLAAPAPIAGGAVHAEVDASDQGYPGSGVHVALDGTLSVDRRVLSGTLSFSGLHSDFDSGCPPTTQPFVAVLEPATQPYDPGHAWSLTGGNLRIDLAGGAIGRLTVTAPFSCGASVNAIDFDTQAYGVGPIPTAADGSFTKTVHVLDEYSVVRVLTLSGSVSGSAASVRLQVASTNVGGWMGDCSGDTTLTASPPYVAPPAVPGGNTPTGATPALGTAPRPTTPVPTGGRQVLANRSGPGAVFDWGAIRIGRGASYSYYFIVEHLSCSGGATHVRITVTAQRVHTVSCRRSRAFATAPVAAGVDYPLIAQAVRLRRGRIVRRGPRVMTMLHMRKADDGWQPVSSLPGRPPTS